MNIKNILIFIIVLLTFDCIRISYYKKENFESRRVLSSRPSKCYDCEIEIAKKQGVQNVWKAQPTKCFDCEKQYLQSGVNPSLTGPTKCFSCENQVEKNNDILNYRLSQPSTSGAMLSFNK